MAGKKVKKEEAIVLFEDMDASDDVEADDIYRETHSEDEDVATHYAVPEYLGFAGKQLSVADTQFAVEVATGQNTNTSDIYRKIYRPETENQTSINTMASRLCRRPDIVDAIEHYRNHLRRQVEVTLPMLVSASLDAINIARNQSNPKAMISGVKELAALMGHGAANESKNSKRGAVVLNLNIGDELRNKVLRTIKTIEDAEVVENEISET